MISANVKFPLGEKRFTESEKSMAWLRFQLLIRTCKIGKDG